MKHILLIAIALITVNATAQEHRREKKQGDRKERAHQLKDFSPEEVATLQTKRMALQLDLTETQQKELQAFHLDQAKSRKSDMEARKKMHEEGNETKPTKEERFNRINDQLDNKLAAKAKMKNVLNKEQYEKWERAHSNRSNKAKAKRSKQGEHKRSRKPRN